MCLLQEEKEQMPKKGALIIITDTPFLITSAPTCGQQCHQGHDRGIGRQRHRQRICYLFMGLIIVSLAAKENKELGPWQQLFIAVTRPSRAAIPARTTEHLSWIFYLPHFPVCPRIQLLWPGFFHLVQEALRPLFFLFSAGIANDG